MPKHLKLLFSMLLAMFLGATNVFATNDFSAALPSSLLPDGFWTLVGLVFGVVVTIGGIVIGIKLMKRARG